MLKRKKLEKNTLKKEKKMKKKKDLTVYLIKNDQIP